MLMIVLDVTVVNVALPYIQNDLGFSASSLAWVVNAYLISFGGLLLLAGRLGDLFGRRRIFLIGLALFTVASARSAHLRSAGQTTAQALTGGYHLGFWISAALVLTAAVVAAFVLQSPAVDTAANSTFVVDTAQQRI